MFVIFDKSKKILIGYIFCFCVFLFFLVRLFGVFHKKPSHSKKQIKGTVVLMPKNLLDVDDLMTPIGGFLGIVWRLWNIVRDVTYLLEDIVKAIIFGGSIGIQLISATNISGPREASFVGKYLLGTSRPRILRNSGKVGNQSYLEKYIPSFPTLWGKPSRGKYNIHFEYEEADFGTPGAFYIENFTHEEFFLVSLTLDIPDKDKDNTFKEVHFVCNSWVYKTHFYKNHRIFFTNDTYLPVDTPSPLVHYREVELKSLRGNGKGERKWHERIYDYDVYNDLGTPELPRQTLGDPVKYPYPRRVRTGRKLTKEGTETPCVDMYVPRDENFGHEKSSDFLAYAIKALCQTILPRFKSKIYDLKHPEFEKFDDVDALYEGRSGIKMPTRDIISEIRSLPFLEEVYGTNKDESVLTFPLPRVIRKENKAWMTDEEFAREMLAGANPNVIRLLQEFPPQSKLDQNSTLTKEHLEINMGGLTVDDALDDNKLFILDYHDAFMPFLEKINNITNTQAYATRTILFLKDGTLKPLAIELSLPNGVESKVVLPPKKDQAKKDFEDDKTIWLLAKAHVIVNDSGYHQLISHWLNTHATMEPFVIATNRQLSALHPIYKLLHPHFRDTININALARLALVNAGGIIEQSFFPGQYSMEISSAVYKDWVFTDQALPNDLIKRGMAVRDKKPPHALHLAVEDYPYAVDGLEIWNAIKNWVRDYVSIYYPTNGEVKNDTELEAWWKEVKEKGHADLKDKPWWPDMQTREGLIESCSIIIWTASALHAAVNFGQYPYGGYILNRPTTSRRLIPDKEDTRKYDEMMADREKAYLSTITSKPQTLIDLSVIEILSKHASDEVYLGKRNNPNWTSDPKALEAFEKFGRKLVEIEDNIKKRNGDSSLPNRTGPVKLPYTVLLPYSEDKDKEEFQKGLTFSGIPNSISI